MTEKYDAKAEYRPDSFWARYDGRSTEVTDTVAGEERHHETYAQRMLRYADDIKSIRWLVRTLRALSTTRFR